MTHCPVARRTHRVGTTLIEVVVALALTALVGLLGALMLDSVARGTSVIKTDVSNTGRRSIALMMWREIVWHADNRPQFDQPLRVFEGDSHRAFFWSWCRTGHGWREPCPVELALGKSGASPMMLVSAQDRWSVPLQSEHAELRFLDESLSPPRWISTWGVSTEYPSAVAVVFTEDTLIARMRRE